MILNLNLLNLFSRLKHLQLLSYFHVLQFHVLHFYVL